ncbi:hypothetical protein [Phytohabitans houttuyneae]|uniref:Uncharacterized protein n=1 Tax=Phytohabitans houttuyneae TaxID=1076126 RepID=A0A6V8JWS4_9ACTN|nr:hypothetical protein [Phytohabitans houttuyneae]GFJ77153.1 hypothetical protein Phou_013330 [Phytohabitans houttuyneae]
MRSVRTLLGFLTISLLVIEGALLLLARAVQDADRAFVILVAVIAFIVLAATVVAIVRPALLGVSHRTPVLAPVAAPDPKPVAYEYDVFISSPMTALTQESYEAHRKDILKFIRTIELRCKFKCYYSGRNRPTLDHFEAVDVGLRNDMEALKKSRYFLLVFPETLVSSVLVEAGMAIVLNKPALYFKRPGVKLPFTLEGAANSTNPELPRTSKYEYKDTADLVRLIQNNGRGIFE